MIPLGNQMVQENGFAVIRVPTDSHVSEGFRPLHQLTDLIHTQIHHEAIYISLDKPALCRISHKSMTRDRFFYIKNRLCEKLVNGPGDMR